MSFLVSIPLFIGLVMLQSAVISRMPLLQGTADLVLLVLIAWALQERVKTAWHWAIVASIFASTSTALPFGTLILAYLLVTGFAIYIRRRIWKAPMLAMLASAFTGTVITLIISYLAVTITGVLIPPILVLNLVILPGVLLNLLLSIPVFILVRDFANWVYPEELEV
jgi:hypothetical protein